MNFYNHHIWSIFKSYSISVTFKFCAVLGAQGIRATGFKRPQGNEHCAKFESNTNRMTFEYALNMMIVKVHPQYWIILEFSRSLFENDDATILFHTTQHKTYYPILGTPNKNLPSESSTSHNSKWSHHTKIFNIDGKFSKFQHNLENRKI